MTQIILKKSNLLKVALYEPDIPQNTAAIIRLCACLGIRLDIIEPCGFLMSDKKFKRIAMDYKNKCNLKSFKNFIVTFLIGCAIYVVGTAISRGFDYKSVNSFLIDFA